MSRRHGFFDYTDGGPHEESEPEEPACIGCGGAVDLNASWNEGLDSSWMCEGCWEQAKADDLLDDEE